MSDLGDPTCWTDREREFFAEGWNACLRMQPGQIERLRAALKPFADFDCQGWDGAMLKGFNRSGQEALLKREHFDQAHSVNQQTTGQEK